MTLDFDDARAIVAANAPGHADPEFVVATWGWGNDDCFTIPSGPRIQVYGPESLEEALANDLVVDDAPTNLVDRTSGAFSLVPGLLGELPYPDMVPVGGENPFDED
jgi:hypothetical protein